MKKVLAALIAAAVLASCSPQNPIEAMGKIDLTRLIAEQMSIKDAYEIVSAKGGFESGSLEFHSDELTVTGEVPYWAEESYVLSVLIKSGDWALFGFYPGQEASEAKRSLDILMITYKQLGSDESSNLFVDMGSGVEMIIGVKDSKVTTIKSTKTLVDPLLLS
jgi:hypothetical protein